MISDPLRRQATDFAERMQSLLSCTIAEHVQIKPTASFDGRLFIVGNQVSSGSVTSKRFALRPVRDDAELWMSVGFQLRLDDEGRYLTVQNSMFGVWPDATTKDAFCHYDYERDKARDYPDAHLQVGGASLAALQPRQALARLHFPVGGKRFRPSLEDVIQFLVRENLAEPTKGWEDVVEESRKGFIRNQLKAAMRRMPDVVEEYLAEQGEDAGWQRVIPKQGGKKIKGKRRQK